MIISSTELAECSEHLLDRVVNKGEIIEIEQNGRVIAEIHPRLGGSRDDIIRMLERINWTEAESRELKAAMDSAADVFGYAGCD